MKTTQNDGINGDRKNMRLAKVKRVTVPQLPEYLRGLPKAVVTAHYVAKARQQEENKRRAENIRQAMEEARWRKEDEERRADAILRMERYYGMEAYRRAAAATAGILAQMRGTVGAESESVRFAQMRVAKFKATAAEYAAAGIELSPREKYTGLVSFQNSARLMAVRRAAAEKNVVLATVGNAFIITPGADPMEVSMVFRLEETEWQKVVAEAVKEAVWDAIGHPMKRPDGGFRRGWRSGAQPIPVRSWRAEEEETEAPARMPMRPRGGVRKVESRPRSAAGSVGFSSGRVTRVEKRKVRHVAAVDLVASGGVTGRQDW